jgi:tetratricopeptide (TPR) repeat protein
MTKPRDLRHASELMGVNPDAEYRRSLMDRIGPEGADLFRALNWSIVPIVAGMLIGAFWVIRNIGLPTSRPLAYTYVGLGALIGAMIFGGGALLFILTVSRGMGEGFGAFIQPKGEYHRDYSREDSLVARGDVAGALSSFESIAAAEPDNVEVRLRAAELYRKNSSFEEAARLYRDVQSKAQRSRDDVHASLRLIDLYLAWPENEGRSMRELKRLIDKYPGTEIEKRSRAALANLKRERFPEVAT